MQTVYTKIAPLWDLGVSISGLKRGISRLILRTPITLPDNATILDVGCGTGIVTIAAHKRWSTAHIIATDINEAMLMETKNALVRATIPQERITLGLSDINNPERVRLLNGEELKLEPESINLIIASAVLEHANVSVAIKQLTALLKPNGFLLSISMRDNLVGRLYGKIYHFDIIPPSVIVNALQTCAITQTTVVPFSNGTSKTNPPQNRQSTAR